MDIVHEKHSLVCSVEKLQENKYRVTFMPRQQGKHRVYVYFNGYDVKGSPFIMRVGTKGRSGKTRNSPIHESKYRSESPSLHYNTASLKREVNSPTNKEIHSATRLTSPIREGHLHKYETSKLTSSNYKTELDTPITNYFNYNKENSKNDYSQTKWEDSNTSKTTLFPTKEEDPYNLYTASKLRSENYTNSLTRQRKETETPIPLSSQHVVSFGGTI